MAPTVGIPLCLDEAGRWRAGRDYVYADRAYADAVTAAGGVALHLPPRSEVAPLLDGIDGLLLPGGDDFPPPPGHVYPDAVRFDPAPRAQLAFDRALLEGALALDLPVLGICYGMQLMAAVGGGRLHLHLPLDRPETGEHRLDEATGRHPIRVAPGSLLAGLLGEAPEPVNSLHHQGVAEPGPQWVASAWAGDGVIEALEHRRHRFALGVQWHPEKLPVEQARPLFRGLVEACQGSAPRARRAGFR